MLTRFSILSFAVLWALSMAACSDERTVEPGAAEESGVPSGVAVPYVITDRPDTMEGFTFPSSGELEELRRSTAGQEAVLDTMREEGITLGMSTEGRHLWLIHDPALSERGMTANWIIGSSDGLLGSPSILARRLARLRFYGEPGKPIYQAVNEQGHVVDEVTGRLVRGQAFGPGGATPEARYVPRDVEYSAQAPSVRLPHAGQVHRVSDALAEEVAPGVALDPAAYDYWRERAVTPRPSSDGEPSGTTP